MDLAARVLTEIDPTAQAPRSIRRAGTSPVVRQVDGSRRAAAAVDAARMDGAEGISAIVVPDALAAEIGHAVGDVETRVLTVADCKGLEFDRTVVVEPAMIVGQSAQGLNDLYVALTRATQQLTVVHADALPAFLATDD